MTETDETPVSGVARRTIRRLETEERRGQHRLVSGRVGRSGMWPMTAPGMPPPGRPCRTPRIAAA